MTRAALLVSLIASAAFAEQRVSLTPCTGPGGPQVSKRLVTALDRSARVQLVETRLDKTITCKVTKSRGWRASIIVRGADGTVLDRVGWSKPSLSRLAAVVPTRVMKRIVREVAHRDTPRREVPAAPAKEPDEADEEEDEGSDEEEEETEVPVALTPRRRSASSSSSSSDEGTGLRQEIEREVDGPAKGERFLSLNAGFGVMSRSFAYADALPAGTRQYKHELPAGPALHLSAKFFPTLGPAPIKHLGLDANMTMLVGAKTRVGDTATDALGLAWDLGLAARIPFGENFGLRARFAFGQQSFDTGLPTTNPTRSPKVAYSYFAPALGARLAIGRFSAEVGGSVLLLQGAGELTSNVFLGRSSAVGFEGQAQLAFRVSESFDVTARGGYRRYLLSATPAAGAAITQGGANDTYLQAGIGLAYRLDF